jgi:hypothetical protein
MNIPAVVILIGKGHEVVRCYSTLTPLRLLSCISFSAPCIVLVVLRNMVQECVFGRVFSRTPRVAVSVVLLCFWLPLSVASAACIRCHRCMESWS